MLWNHRWTGRWQICSVSWQPNTDVTYLGSLPCWGEKQTRKLLQRRLLLPLGSLLQTCEQPWKHRLRSTRSLLSQQAGWVCFKVETEDALKSSYSKTITRGGSISPLQTMAGCASAHTKAHRSACLCHPSLQAEPVQRCVFKCSLFSLSHVSDSW